MHDDSPRATSEFQQDRRKHRLKARKQAIERQRATNESINTLLEVLKYLNSVQDGAGLRIDQDYSHTNMEKRSRILNCHEEDIMNASLITMRRLIETLLPAPKHSAARANRSVPAADRAE
jgi:hypothetical protein